MSMATFHIDGKPIHYFESRFFTLRGDQYEIIGSYVPAGKRVDDMVSTVRRLKDRETKDVPQKKLFELLIHEKRNKI